MTHRILLTLIVAVALVSAPLVAGRSPQLVDDDTAARVETLLAQLTLEEKLSLLSGNGFDTRPIERLGIPALHMTDGPAGVRAAPATAFPSGVALAATFDPEIVESVARALAQETKAKGFNVLLGPCVNIQRAPHGGRNFESFGEDPYLAARLTVAYVKGLQAERVMAAVKHYAANNQEIERHTIDVRVSERALEEMYLPAFKAAVQEGGALSVMAAYNKVNGLHATENPWLLTDVLRRRWQFQGLVMSDWDAVTSMEPTLNAGLDLEMPHDTYLKVDDLRRALEAGRVTRARVDEAVRRLLTVIGALGLLQPADADHGSLDTPEHRRVAREAAEAGTVLLKNDGPLLPIDPARVRSIAVIGPNAAVLRVGGGGSSKVVPFRAVSPLDAIRARAGKRLRVDFAPGVIALEDTTPIPTENLRTPDGRPGLRGEYFTNLDFAGTPALDRVDPRLEFRWATGSPAAGFPSEGFSVRWTGTLTAPAAGRYVISLASNDGGRLFLDDEKVVDVWGDHATLTGTAIVDLDPARPKRVRVEYYEKQGNADIVLGWQRLEGDPLQTAVDLAKRADLAIVCAGLSEAIETEAKDRDDLHLPAAQERLIQAVTAANPRTVVVLNSGGPLLMERWVDRVPAVLQAFYPGQEGGTALARVLFGDVSPSGRLPATYPGRWEDSSAYGHYPGSNGVVSYDEGIFVGYRHFDRARITPLFPFGHGLSYTTFRYSDIEAAAAGTAETPLVTVRLVVENTGERDGAEVVQIYVREMAPEIDRPVRELKAFRRVPIAAHARQLVEFQLEADAFSYYDPERHDWRINPGEFEIEAGASSRDIRATTRVALHVQMAH